MADHDRMIIYPPAPLLKYSELFPDHVPTDVEKMEADAEAIRRRGKYHAGGAEADSLTDAEWSAQWQEDRERKQATLPKQPKGI